MIEIPISKQDLEFVCKYAERQTIGGYSNLSKSDLSKASRNEFQWTGISAESAWYTYRYGNYDKLRELLDFKFNNLRPQRKGDGGFDDSITYNDKTRLIDIKASHIENTKRIQYLNLIIPRREFHLNSIYLCAFTVGKTRTEIEKVILQGWVFNEDVHKKWPIDPNKFCVPVKELRPMEEMEQYLCRTSK